MDSWSIGVGLIVAATIAIVFGLRVKAHRSDYAREHFIKAWFFGPHAGRQYFDEDGWRYRNISVFGSLAVWVASLVVAAVVR